MECQVDRQVVTNRIFIEFGPVCVLRVFEVISKIEKWVEVKDCK